MFRLSITLALLLFSRYGFACSCVPNTLFDHWEQNDNIFVVDVKKIEVVEKADPETYSSGLERGSFDVVEAYKGNPHSATYLTAANQPICCNCTTKLELGKYLVFSSRAGSVPVSFCSGTKPLGVYKTAYPYFEEVFQYLKDQILPQRFVGTYFKEKGEFLVDGAEKTIKLHNSHYEYVKGDRKLDIEAYLLKTGDLFFFKEHSAIELSSGK